MGSLFAGSGASARLVLAFDAPGTLGPNTVREPGEVNVDLAIDRRIRLAGRTSVTLRLEVFNALNRVNLNGPPDSPRSSFDSTSKGRIDLPRIPYS